MYKSVLYFLVLNASFIHPLKITKEDPSASFTISLGKKSQKEYVERIRCRLVQDNDWSCGLHAIFHALAIERALKKPAQFETTLKKNLADKAFLRELLAVLRKHKKQKTACTAPLKEFGLCSQDIEHIARVYGIKHKIICVELTDKDTLESFTCPDNVSQVIAHLHDPLKQIKKLIQNTKTTQTTYIFTIIHTDSVADAHWMLFACVNLPQKAAKLYLLDSGNEKLWAHAHKYTNLLAPFVAELNKIKKSLR